MLKHFSFYAFLLLLSMQGLAQNKAKRVYITDSGELYSTYDFSTDDRETLKKAVGAANVDALIAAAVETAWPAGISTLDARNENRPKIADYVVYEVTKLGDKLVLQVPAAENKQMDAAMQSKTDFYLIISDKGVGDQPGAAPAKGADNGEADQRVYVDDPGQLMSTYNLTANEEAKELLADYLSDEEFQQMADLCLEKNWPAGIATFDARSKGNREKIKDYFIYFGASFMDGDDEVVLGWVPYEENQTMPEDMRPVEKTGFYMVFKAKGVTVK